MKTAYDRRLSPSTFPGESTRPIPNTAVVAALDRCSSLLYSIESCLSTQDNVREAPPITPTDDACGYIAYAVGKVSDSDVVNAIESCAGYLGVNSGPAREAFLAGEQITEDLVHQSFSHMGDEVRVRLGLPPTSNSHEASAFADGYVAGRCYHVARTVLDGCDADNGTSINAFGAMFDEAAQW